MERADGRDIELADEVEVDLDFGDDDEGEADGSSLGGGRGVCRAAYAASSSISRVLQRALTKRELSGLEALLSVPLLLVLWKVLTHELGWPWGGGQAPEKLE
jgi:hypothetical protein